jgi:hypothetical protein
MRSCPIRPVPSPRPSPRARGSQVHRRGAGLVIALVTLLIITSTMGAIIHSLLIDLRQTRQAANELQAHWLADSAVSRAAAQVGANPRYQGETWRPTIAAESDQESVGVAEIKVERLDAARASLKMTVEARYPDHPWRRVVTRRIFVIPTLNENPTAGASPQETAP